MGTAPGHGTGPTYDGFGRIAIWAPDGSALAQSAVGNTFLFSSKLFDTATGLYDFNARWYDPALGRFISPDPLGFVDGPNPYAYCSGDPVNFVDPWGLCAEGGFTRVEPQSGPFSYYYPNRPTWYNGLYSDVSNSLAWGFNTVLRLTVPFQQSHQYAYENWELYEGIVDLAGSDEATFLALVFPASGGGMALRNAGYLAESVSALARSGWARFVPRAASAASEAGIRPGTLLPEGRLAGDGPGAMLPNKVPGAWGLTADGAYKVIQHPRFGSFYRSASDGSWWVADSAQHGGSAFKVYRETGKGLQWYRDADQFGDFMSGKHKGPTGQFIPWKEFTGR